MENVYETFLPLFNGFYNTVFEFDYDYIEEFIQQERKDAGLFSDVNYNELKIDESTYEHDIVISFCESIRELLSDFIISVELQKIVSPKAYNFVNDTADVKIEIKSDEVKSFIYLHREKFCEFLKSRYTSYDGFFSHYANDFETWETETKSFTDFSCNGHYIGAILEFIAIENKIDECSIAQDILENICCIGYVENLNELINKKDGSLFELLTSNGIEKTFADYIEASYNNGIINELVLSEKILSVIREYENKLVEA